MAFEKTKRYLLTYGRNSQIIWALVLPAFIGLIPLMISIELANKYKIDSNWLTILITPTYLIMVLLATFLWIKSIQKNVIVEIEKDNLQIHFQKKNIFHSSSIYLPLTEIVNTYMQNDKGYAFLYIETKKSRVKNFYLRAKETDPELMSLNLAINQYIEKSDYKVGVYSKLLHLTIYKKWPMKVLGSAILVLMVTLPIYMFLHEKNPLTSAKYWILIITGSPIIYKVFIQKLKELS